MKVSRVKAFKRKVYRVTISGCVLTLLSACSVFSSDDTASQHAPPAFAERAYTDTSKLSIHHYVEQLTRQLLLTAQGINLKQTVAVGTFLPTQSINGKNMPTTNVLGQQIQESFVTLATQAGLNVIEFKTAKAIKIQHNQDLMLSRQISEINPYIQADYYLTGTYTAQQDNLAINARLIETSSQRVIAAATDFIPSNVMWAQGKVMMQDNSIYRRAY
ncbi:MAG: TolB-like protein [Paraglaciecola sp.]